MGAARLKHICPILQMLRESTSAVSAQLSNGRGPGLTQDLQGHGFVAKALDKNCCLLGPGMRSTRSNWTWTQKAARVKINFHRIPDDQALDSHTSFTTVGNALIDLGGPLGPYCKPPRLQWIVSLVLVGHVILTLFRLICNPKLRIARKRGPLPR